MWTNLTPDAKSVFEDKAEALKNEYKQKMAEFRNHPDFNKIPTGHD